jgi:hypothetical protein
MLGDSAVPQWFGGLRASLFQNLQV